MKKVSFLFLLSSILIIVSCSFSQPENNGTEKIDEEQISTEKQMTELEEFKKFELFPDARNQSWLIEEAEKDFIFLGQKKKSIDRISTLCKNAVVASMWTKVYKKTKEYDEFTSKRVGNIHCDISYKDIKKGDIILTTTNNPVLIGVDGANNVHHALLCVKDPTCDDDNSLITTYGGEKPEVALYSITHIKNRSIKAVIMRLNKVKKAQTEKITSFAIEQIGKPYNYYYIDKENSKNYYCSQLVWQAFLEGGVNIDANNDDYNDYGIVLASDILKSQHLYIAVYFEQKGGENE